MPNEKYQNLTSFFLRIGVALVFLYAAVASLLDPNSWIGFLPLLLKKFFPANLLLIIFSVYEIILAFWLISGKQIFFAAVFASFTLLAIILQNIGALDIIFRDVAIFFAALALMVLARGKN